MRRQPCMHACGSNLCMRSSSNLASAAAALWSVHGRACRLQKRVRMQLPCVLLPPLLLAAQALGHHQASLAFNVLSCRPGMVGRQLGGATVAAQGSSLALGKKAALPGGLGATPATFKKTRWVVPRCRLIAAAAAAEPWLLADTCIVLGSLHQQSHHGPAERIACMHAHAGRPWMRTPRRWRC